MAEARKSLRAIFDEASEMAPGEQRQAWLDQACGGDAALRANVEELLRSQETAAGFLANPKRDAPTVSAEVTEREGDRIGRYKLLQKIGEGGCGIVYMAEQTEPVRRRVALKVIKLGMDTRSVIARFEAERQALAMMDHANIARVLDAGATDSGRPYFVMELVRGIKITDYCEKNHLSTAARLQLFIQVCQAVQHAHQKGIIHRDLKPSNILVTSDDGVPLPKVIDFGIAKATADIQLTDKTLFTRFEMFIGTPAYMSPEQAEFNASDIDTRTDIYALGVLLYELLTGQTPFDNATLLRSGLDAMRKTIRETDPPRPSTRLTRELAAAEGAQRTAGDSDQPTFSRLLRLKETIQQLRGDLDWIILKALEKDRIRRYDTANGLAMDIQRYLANEPVVARPPSTAYRIHKAWQRNKLAFSATALVFLALAFGGGAVMFVQHRANAEYRRRLYVSEVNRAGLAWQDGHTVQMRVLLERCPEDLRNWEWQFLHQQLDRWDNKLLFAARSFGAAALSANRDLLVVAADGAIQVRAIPSGQWLRNVTSDGSGKIPFALAPRGDLLATADPGEGVITIWNARTGERTGSISNVAASVLAWANDGRHLASGEEAMVRIWNATTGGEALSCMTTARVLSLAFAPDDKTLAVGTAGRNIDLLDAATGDLRRRLVTRGPFFLLLKFSPDGRLLAAANATSGGFKRDHRAWDLEDGGSLDLNTGAEASSYSFSADGQRLVVGDVRGMIQVWDLDRRAEVERFSAHQGQITSVHLLPDERILSGSVDGVKLWEARRPGVTALKVYRSSLRTVSFSPDSRWVAASGLGSELLVWDARGGLLAGIYKGHHGRASAMAFSPDGLVASADGERMVKLWDPVSRETKWEMSLAPAEPAYWVAFSPDGRRLYVPSARATLTVLDPGTGSRLNSITGLENVLDGIAVSPDGKLIALCQKAKLSVRRADDLQEAWSADAQPNRCAAFSPDGKWLATGDQDGMASLWEVAAEGRVRRRLAGHAAPVFGVSFHPDGSRLVTCGDGVVKVWDWRAGVELLTLPHPGGGILWHATFSPDGKMIAAAGGDGIVTLWKVE